MKTPTQHQRMHGAARAIRGTLGEFRRVAILYWCAAALEVLKG